MEHQKTPSAPPLPESALPSTVSSASNTDEETMLNGVLHQDMQQQRQICPDKEMVLPSAPLAQPNQQYSTLWSQFGVSQAAQQQDKLRQDKRYPDTVSSASSTDEDMIRYGAWHPDEQQQNQIRPDKKMVLPSAPMAQPNQQYPTLWSQFGVSQATQQQDKLRQDKRYPDTVSSASSTDEDMIGYDDWHPDKQQQNPICPVCGQRHEYQLGCTRHKILMDKSVEPRNVDYTISEWAKTRPIYSQANDQGTLFIPKVPEQKEEKQQDNHLIAQRSTEEFLKEINENEWLCKYTIEACTNFLKKQFPNKIKGLSEPVKELTTPTPSTTSNEVPRGQVLFGKGHWRLSLSTKPNEVFYIDSDIDPLSKGETKRELSSNLINQIKQSHKVPYQGSLKVSWLDVQQQENNFDCGVFVIAFLVEFFFDPRIERLRSIAFETSQNQMRRHLSECFKKREFSPFPKRKEYLPTPGIPGNLPYVILQ